MPDLPALRLFLGHTVHQRSIPFVHRFKYDLALIDLDIDRLDEAGTQSRLFSVDKGNLFSFRRRDHGNRKPEALRPWAEEQFEQAGVQLEGGPVRLITFPRHAFYKFAPISLWLGHGPDGTLRGIIYEVNNTFGESHTYVAPTPDVARNQHATDKVFHVSPFFDISGKYRFTLKTGPDLLSLIVATETDNGNSHVATIQARARAATTGAFIQLAMTRPVSSLGVTAAIHWQALKLWIKGAKYHSKPKQSDVRTTIAEPTSSTSETLAIPETPA